MTTICYRGGVLAADTRAGWGDFMSPQRQRKIWDVGGTLIGISGDISYLQPLIRYIEESGPQPWSGDEARALIVTKTQVRMLGGGGENVIDAPFIAIGSGSPAAFAAMHMGADARRAVEIAMLVDPFTGGEIDVLRLNDTKAQPDDAETQIIRIAGLLGYNPMFRQSWPMPLIAACLDLRKRDGDEAMLREINNLTKRPGI